VVTTIDVPFRLPERTGIVNSVAGGTPGGVIGGVPGGVAAGVSQGSAQTQRIKVGANVQESQLLERVHPVYPPLALQARIQGIVRFNAVIGADGRVTNLRLTSGHPLLVEAARDAVKRWRYRTTLLNGSPVEVVTMIDVPFKLPE
jgi:protein TonB